MSRPSTTMASGRHFLTDRIRDEMNWWGHALVLEQAPDNLPARLMAAARGQRFAADAAVTCVWSAIPSRIEWRYAEASYKVVALDAGHVCQNLYLACEAIGAGTCAIAAYNQEVAGELIGTDGTGEFTVYLAPVGKVKGG